MYIRTVYRAMRGAVPEGQPRPSVRRVLTQLALQQIGTTFMLWSVDAEIQGALKLGAMGDQSIATLTDHQGDYLHESVGLIEGEQGAIGLGARVGSFFEALPGVPQLSDLTFMGGDAKDLAIKQARVQAAVQGGSVPPAEIQQMLQALETQDVTQAVSEPSQDSNV